MYYYNRTVSKDQEHYKVRKSLPASGTDQR